MYIFVLTMSILTQSDKYIVRFLIFSEWTENFLVYVYSKDKIQKHYEKNSIWILSFDVANLQALQLCHILNIKWYFLVKDENLISIQYYLYYILSRWCWQYLKNIKKRAITVIVKNGVILQFFSSIRMAPFGSLRSKKSFLKTLFFSTGESPNCTFSGF